MSTSPDPASSLSALCSNLLLRGQAHEALSLCQRAIALSAGSAESWNAVAKALVALGGLDAARDSFSRALRLRPDDVEAAFALGNLLAALGQPLEAIAHFTRAAVFRPDLAEAYNNLALTLQAILRHRDALQPLQRAVSCRRDYIDAQANLANCLCLEASASERSPDMRIGQFRMALVIAPSHADALCGIADGLVTLGRPADALWAFSAALSVRADFALAHNNLGSALQDLNPVEQAVARRHFRAAIVLQPDYSHPYNNLAAALQSVDDGASAVASYRRATLLAPDDGVACNNLGVALLEAGEFGAAAQALERAVTLAPRRGYFYRTLAETGRIDAGSPHLARMAALLGDEGALPDAERMELHFACAKVYEDLGARQRSFDHLLAGNRLKRAMTDYDEAATFAEFDAIREVFATLPQDRLEFGRQAIFVVGMPRSGTTLVEQILASHAEVHGAGEIPDLRRLVDGVGAFPGGCKALSPSQLSALGRTYLDRLQARAPDAGHIVDKMPNNFLLIGLIRLALPGAAIIHVQRDPLDTCLSCFSKLFAGSQPFAYDLAELGRYYQAYQRLMDHWRQRLPAGAMLEVRYEDVVDDLERQARRLLDFCGLAWDERCLSFHHTRRVVKTASMTQVRRPIHDGSVGKWRIDETRIKPLLDALARA